MPRFAFTATRSDGSRLVDEVLAADPEAARAAALELAGAGATVRKVFEAPPPYSATPHVPTMPPARLNGACAWMDWSPQRRARKPLA